MVDFSHALANGDGRELSSSARWVDCGFGAFVRTQANKLKSRHNATHQRAATNKFTIPNDVTAAPLHGFVMRLLG